LAQFYIDAFYEDMGKLGVLNADFEPRATEHIEGMVEMIKTLIEKGYAYEGGEDVYYAVESFQGYGDLSGRRLEDMQAGSRIAVDKKKRHPMDFVLWKSAKEGEPQWQSPWGPGRPGWHMECSVMSAYFLGDTFDIHGGGKDLLFPHHENERAQSIAANAGEFARYWVHNGFVTVEAEKMSKSLGNFLTIRDALESYHPEVLRLFLISKHYRSPIDFAQKAVQGTQAGLVRIYRTLQRLEKVMGRTSVSEEEPSISLAGDQEEPFLEKFVQVMDDDINTAGAIGLIFEKVKEMNRLMDQCEKEKDEKVLTRLEKDREHLIMTAGILGILAERPEDFFEKVSKDSGQLNAQEIENLIMERTEARAGKDWARADAIRDQLKGMGVVLEDGPEGTTWRHV
jgi:cysteinyl-tRNA synthetase